MRNLSLADLMDTINSEEQFLSRYSRDRNKIIATTGKDLSKMT